MDSSTAANSNATAVPLSTAAGTSSAGNTAIGNNANNNTTSSTTGGGAGGTGAGGADPLQMEDVVSTNAVTAEVIARQNQTVVEEFQYLLEKSQQLFAGLRDLPPTGAKQWQPYFQKTFEIFTKLWKFQQQNRFALENSYGLKRWEVGEIASKIGQLYYHYYLRTSETNYLQESFVFYDAIRDRGYFNEISEVKTAALMIKRLRYYARFIVACLLLNKRDIITTLKQELTQLVNEYIATFRPADAAEWQLVLREVSAFTDAEKKLYPVNLSSGSMLLPTVRRLQVNKLIVNALDKESITGSSTSNSAGGTNTSSSTGSTSTRLRLQEAILIGNYQNQIKFSELTIDMYRMLQSLEREVPSSAQASSAASSVKGDSKDSGANAGSMQVGGSGDSSHGVSGLNNIKEEPVEEATIAQRRLADKTGGSGGGTGLSAAGTGSTSNVDKSSGGQQASSGAGGSTTTGAVSSASTASAAAVGKKPNPHKYLLYRPTLSQLMVYLATAYREVSSDAAFLVYLSADGSKKYTSSSESEGGVVGYQGGILTNFRKTTTTSDGSETAVDQQQQSISHCLHPGDLIPFTRKSMVLIVDSNNSSAFADMPKVFSHPFMSLLSPAEYPDSIPDTSQVGSLFTLFLHAPLLAFSFIAGVSQISLETWEQCNGLILQAEGKIAELLATAASLPPTSPFSLDKSTKKFLQDDYLRQFMIRFALCHVVLNAHVAFTEPKHLPTMYPPLPPTILGNAEVLSKLRALAILANAKCFVIPEPMSTVPGPITPTGVAPLSTHSSTSSMSGGGSEGSGVGGGGAEETRAGGSSGSRGERRTPGFAPATPSTLLAPKLTTATTATATTTSTNTRAMSATAAMAAGGR